MTPQPPIPATPPPLAPSTPPISGPTPPPPTPPVPSPGSTQSFEDGGQMGRGLNLVEIGFMIIGVASLIVMTVKAIQRGRQSKKLASNQQQLETRLMTVETVMKEKNLMAA